MEEKSKTCGSCFLWRAAASWIGTPFKFRDCVKGRGADCVSAPLSIWKEIRGITSDQFRQLYSAQMLHLFRTDQERFKKRLVKILGPKFKLNQPELKCGDLLVKIIGKSHEMFSAVYVKDQFITSRPAIGVTWVQSFTYDYKITWTGFRCLLE